MKMGHGLTGRLLAIDNDSVSILDAQLLGKPHGHHMQMTKKRFVFFLQIGMGRDYLLGNDENMSWSLRIDVAKGKAFVVIMDDGGRDLTIDYFEKKIVLKHG